MPIRNRKFSRRSFLAASGAVAVPLIVPSSVFGNNAPSNRITLGFIGMGGQGITMNLNNFLNQQDAKAVAVCDAYLSRAKYAANLVDQKYETKGCKVYQDFRKIIADPTIDAVVISTPDHWHVPMSMMAIEAGKDVFCEKPTLYIDEGRQLAETVARHKAVFQAGIEDRSTLYFHRMVGWVRNGAIGTLQRIDVTMPAGLSFPKE